MRLFFDQTIFLSIGVLHELLALIVVEIFCEARIKDCNGKQVVPVMRAIMVLLLKKRIFLGCVFVFISLAVSFVIEYFYYFSAYPSKWKIDEKNEDFVKSRMMGKDNNINHRNK